MMDRLPSLVLSLVLAGIACSGPEEKPSPAKAAPESGSSEGVQLIAEPIHDVYSTSGPLEVRIAISNASDAEFVFRPILDFGAFLDADVVDGDGQVLPRRMELDPPNAGEVRLAAGETYSATVDIRCSLLVSQLNECMQMYDLSEPGVYEVRMRFTAPCDPPNCTEAHRAMVAKPFELEIRQ